MIMQDWEPDWKVPSNKIVTEHPDNEEEDQGNGQSNSAGDVQHTIPQAGEKRKDKGKRTTTSAWKKMKSHKEPSIYTLMDDDIDNIDYQVRDFAEEAIQQALKKQEEMH
jgi:hypothetical protein